MCATHAGPPDQHEAITAMVKNAYLPNLLPLSWGAGLCQAFTWPLICGSVTIFLPATMPQPVTAEYVYEAITQTPRGPRNCIMLTPNILRELAGDQKRLASLGKYEWVGYAGAPLDRRTGDLISRHARVQSMMGATDVGAFPVLLNDPKDWEIHRLYETWGFHFQHFADDLYELCVHRQPNEHRHCFVTNPDPDLKVAHTKDLFRSVPGRKGFYSTAGRVDDFVKLSSMTKFNAINIEQILDTNSTIKGSIVAGDDKPRPFVLVEPSDSLRKSSSSEAEMIDRIWDTFEEANKILYAEARLTKELTLITSPDKPIKRTAKGTADRRNTLSMYNDKIEHMYAQANGTVVGNGS